MSITQFENEGLDAALLKIQELETEATPGAAHLLQKMVWSSDKSIAKYARTALYRLKVAGIEASEDTEPVNHVATIAQPTTMKGYITNVAGNGNQMILFIQEERFGGSPLFMSFLLNHSEGLAALGNSKVSKRDCAEALANLKKPEGSLLSEAPVDYVRSILAEAVENTAACKRNPPKGFHDMMEIVGSPDEHYSEPMIYQFYDRDQVRSDMSISRDTGKFFDLPFFRGWMLDINEVSPWEEKYWETVQSNLSLDPVHLAKRGEGVVSEAADALLAGNGLSALRRRLEEQALALHLSGETEPARSTLYHALSLDVEFPHESAFVQSYTLRSIQIVMALKAEAEDDQGVQDMPENSEDESPKIIIGR